MSGEYAVASSSDSGVEIVTLSHSERTLASIVPSWGNSCHVLTIDGYAILEEVALSEAIQRPTSYGVPILFPFPNRIAAGRFRFREREFLVDPSRHGYVRDKPWRVAAQGATEEEGAWVTSVFDAAEYPVEILKQYPFPFRLAATYRLHQQALSLEIDVTNTGESDLPCGLGLHPYFRLPPSGTLQVPANELWELDAERLPTGKKLPVTGSFDLRQPRAVSELAMDDVLTTLTSDAHGGVECTLRDLAQDGSTVIQFSTEQFPHVVVYTPPAPRRAICIEPYTCPTDGFNLTDRGVPCGMLTVAPGQSRSFSVAIARRRP